MSRRMRAATNDCLSSRGSRQHLGTAGGVAMVVRSVQAKEGTL
jgi:hypothetical protein